VKNLAVYQIQAVSQPVLAGALLALAAQTGLLFVSKGFPHEEWIRDMIPAGFVALLLQLGAYAQNLFLRAIGVVMTMTVLGSLGMSLGAIIDAREKIPVVCSDCQTESVISWANGLMLIFCLFGCRLCMPYTDNRRVVRMCRDCICLIGMTAGMLIGGNILTQVLTLLHGDYIDMHWTMLSGMFLGNICGLTAFALSKEALNLLKVRSKASPPR